MHYMHYFYTVQYPEFLAGLCDQCSLLENDQEYWMCCTKHLKHYEKWHLEKLATSIFASDTISVNRWKYIFGSFSSERRTNI